MPGGFDYRPPGPADVPSQRLLPPPRIGPEDSRCKPCNNTLALRKPGLLPCARRRLISGICRGPPVVKLQSGGLTVACPLPKGFRLPRALDPGLLLHEPRLVGV